MEVVPTKDVISISETPSEVDLFSGGAHQRTAQELVRAIDQIKGCGGAIGLEGGWGSGKSTVIKLAKKILYDRSGAVHIEEIITFDLWKYQNQDIKRAFVDRLLSYVEENFGDSKNEIRSIKRRHFSVIEETEDKSERIYSLTAIFFLIISPLLPLLLAWAGPASFSAAAVPTYLFWIDVRLALIGLILFGYALALARFAKALLAVGPAFPWIYMRRGLIEALSVTVNVFGKDGDSTRQIKTVAKTNPTQDEFSDVVRSALGILKRYNHTVFIVFDNIDRIDSHLVPIIWSDIRLIYAQDDNDFNFLHSAVAIIPFDRNFIDTAMKTSTGPSDVIAKSFSRVLRVPPPVFTDWEKFLSKIIGTAFSNTVDATDVYRIARIIDSKFSNSLTGLTPRFLIGFVNDLGSTWVQRDCTIPLLSIALFLSKRDELRDHDQLVTEVGNLTSTATTVGADPEWFKHIVALCFGVSPEHAYQTLLQPDLIRHLQEADPDKFLSMQLTPGFEVVLVRVIDGYSVSWAASDPNMFFRVVGHLSKLNLSSNHIRDVWERLRTAAQTLRPGSVIEPHPLKHLPQLVSNQPTDLQRATAIGLVNWVARCVDAVGSDNVGDGEIWIRAADSVIALFAGDNTLRKSVLDEIVAPVSARNAVGIARGSIETSIKLEDIKFDLHSSSITEAFQFYLASGGDRLYSTYQALFGYTEGTDDVTTLGTALAYTRSEAAASRSAHFSIIPLLAMLLCRNLKTDDYAARLAEAVNDGSIAASTHTDDEPGDTVTSSAYCWLTTTATSSLAPPSQLAHPTFEDAASAGDWHNLVVSKVSSVGIPQLAQWIERGEQFPWWHDLATDPSSPHLAQRTLTKLIERNTLGALNIRTCLLNYPKVKTIVGSKLASIYLRRLDGWTKYLDLNFKSESVLDIPVETIEDSVALRTLNSKWICSKIDEHFLGMSKDQWKDIIASNDERLAALLARRLAGSGYPPTEPFKKGLIEYLQSVATEQTLPAADRDWRGIVNAMRPNSRPRFIQDLHSLISARRLSQPAFDALHSMVGSYFIHMPLTKNISRTIDRFVIPLALSSELNSAATLSSLVSSVAESPTLKPTKNAKQRLVAAYEELPRVGKLTNRRKRESIRALLAALD